MNKPKRLNVLFVPTSSSGIMHWRIQSFVNAAWRTGLANLVNPLWFKDLRDIQPWQKKLTDGPDYDPMFLRSFVPMIESGCQQADVVVFQFCHEEGALELFDAIRIKFPHLTVLVEIDDNILAVPHYNEAFVTYDPRYDVRQRTLTQIRAADGVITTTPYLKEVYAEYNKNIFVVPNSVDFKKWDGLKRKSKPGVRIGWAGGSAHEGDFLTVENAVKNVARDTGAKFVFVNGPAKTGLPAAFHGVKGIEHKAAWVAIDRYPQLLADLDFDIGVAPLIDSGFNRGKSNLKWLENAALGIPTVAHRVGHFAETLDNPESGCLLADNEAEFEDHLKRLVKDRKLRTTLGRQANAYARKHFSVENTLKHYIACLHEAIERKASAEVPA